MKDSTAEVTTIIRTIADVAVGDIILYAGLAYEVKYKGEKVLHLKSLQDRNLVIHCPVSSTYLDLDISGVEIQITNKNSLVLQSKELPVTLNRKA